MVGIDTDITKRMKLEENARLSETVFNGTSEAIMLADADKNIISVNPAFSKITGYSADEVIGKNPRILKSGKHDPVFYSNMLGALEKNGQWEGEIWNKRKDGSIYPEWLSISTVKNSEGEILQYLALFNDITKRKEDEKELHFRAYYDTVTKLPNRALAFERLSQTIMQANRHMRKAALFFLDLDHFKQVNDTLGHVVGDKVLMDSADRLRSAVRETDTVARTGGDEFLIILTEVFGTNEAAIVADKILNNMSQAFQVEGHRLFLGASIGITMIPENGREVTKLLKNADMAMYQAKASGRNTYRFYDKKIETRSKDRILLEWDLKQAIKNHELLLHYQPIVKLSSLQTVSLEALVRWRHPRRGLLSPKQFIPLAENSTLISQIGEWGMMTACTQLKKWQDQYRVNTDIAVNLSSLDFRYGTFWSSISNALNQSGLPAESLILEITESLMLDGNEDVLKNLQTIKDVGIRLAIDDFGTGYSSLSHLSRYPIDLLKIDQSFVTGFCNDQKKKSLVEAIIRMAQSLGMKVIAEGVETYEDLSGLMELDCDKVQGFYFSKPLSAEDYEMVLKKQQIDSS